MASLLAFWLVLGGVPTSLLNRAIIPALPGSRSGIEQLLERAMALGSVSSQLLALVLSLLLVRLIGMCISAAAVGALERVFVLPIGSAVGFLVIAASVGRLDAELHLMLAGVSSLGLCICTRPALRHPTTRAGGILLAFVVAASVWYASARLVALRASLDAVPRQYLVARVLATMGQAFDGLALGWVLVWMAKSSGLPGTLRTVVVIASTLLIGAWARLGQGTDPTFLQIVAARGLDALVREPRPFTSTMLGPVCDVLALLAAAALVTMRDPRNRLARRAMALLLLSRCSLDVPAMAGMATAGGLLLAWFAPEADTGATSRQPDLLRESSNARGAAST